MPAVADPPAAPAAPPASPNPPAQVAASSIPVPINPSEPKPGSARAALRAGLEKIAKPMPEGFNAPEPATPPAVTPKSAGDEPPAAPAAPDPNAPPAEPADPNAPPKPADDPNKGKKPTKDFWKTFDEWKGRATKAETDLAELKKQITPETDRKAFTEKLTNLEKRNAELEEHIRFVDYSKSQEFQDKYVKPYNAAWSRAMEEVSQIKVKDGESERPASAQDMLALVQLPLGDARALANQMFGDFANDVMAYRKEIRTIYDAQTAALDEARKSTGERIKQATEQAQHAHAELTKFIADTWTKANAEVQADPDYGKYFKPVDGDEEGNKRLEAGFKFVDQAFAENPMDPKLTPQQRAAAIWRHAKVRNRAAMAGRLVYQNKKLQAQLADLEKKLADYKGSAPPGGSPPPSGSAPASQPKAWDALRAGLAKIAK